MRRIWDARRQSFVVHIFAGECHVTSAAEPILTLLGSCVAVCIFDPEARVGGMNHFMLPTPAFAPSSSIEPASYGSFAMDLLINGLLKMGAERRRFQIKAFGGSEVVPRMSAIGARNISFIKSYLRDEGMTMLAEDLGGRSPRKVIYDPLRGSARVLHLPAQTTSIAESETSYLTTVEQRPLTSSVDFFE